MSSQNKNNKKSKKAVAKRSNVYKARGSKVRGRGDFWTDAKDYFTAPQRLGGVSRINNLLSSTGEAMGNAIHPVVGKLGASAGSWLSKVLGLGKYKVAKNSLMHPKCIENMPYIRRPPSFGSTSKGSDIEICHEEYIQDVTSSTDFASTQIVNNPGNSTAFPWLASFARNYEYFEWLGLIYYYKTTSSVATGSTSGAMGTINIATDYDCTDSAFQDKRHMENTEYASDAAPYQDFMHPIECDPKRNVMGRMMYVLPDVSSVPDYTGGAAKDPRFSIPSITTVAAVGNATTNEPLGELWVSYHVRLSRPTFDNITEPMFYQEFQIEPNGTIDTTASTKNNNFTLTVASDGNHYTLTGGGDGYYQISTESTGSFTAGNGSATSSFTGGWGEAEILPYVGFVDVYTADSSSNLSLSNIRVQGTGSAVFYYPIGADYLHILISRIPTTPLNSRRATPQRKLFRKRREVNEIAHALSQSSDDVDTPITKLPSEAIKSPDPDLRIDIQSSRKKQNQVRL